jgi:hypothetical protein
MNEQSGDRPEAWVEAWVSGMGLRHGSRHGSQAPAQVGERGMLAHDAVGAKEEP